MDGSINKGELFDGQGDKFWRHHVPPSLLLNPVDKHNALLHLTINALLTLANITCFYQLSG
jgi:hypothetical protein